ncbi:hypothetical protein PR048_008757 [Dryococelus australis]|uniref:Uncharacterized protein n=1 Tax=Dryococelus australis TaxID=614101 RepID=A0ABQ9HY18_9NEOP|nr:hypothetical protein PR048_008757 [Dryococelus australis]
MKEKLKPGDPRGESYHKTDWRDDMVSARYPQGNNSANKLVPNIYAKTVLCTQNTLEESEFVRVTMDQWTSSANDDYLRVTVHFIDNSFIAQHLCIERYLIQHRTSSVFLQKTLLEWKINEKVLVVDENARNVVAALNLSSFSHILAWHTHCS